MDTDEFIPKRYDGAPMTVQIVPNNILKNENFISSPRSKNPV